jgi:hypothetical protein
MGGTQRNRRLKSFRPAAIDRRVREIRAISSLNCASEATVKIADLRKDSDTEAYCRS